MYEWTKMIVFILQIIKIIFATKIFVFFNYVMFLNCVLLY